MDDSPSVQSTLPLGEAFVKNPANSEKERPGSQPTIPTTSSLSSSLEVTYWK